MQEGICNLCSKEFKTERYIKFICLTCIDSMVQRVDRRQPHSLYKHVVYGLDRDRELVYIGVTGNYQVRLHDHKLSKDFDEMKIIRSFKKREMADEFEKTAIFHHRPNLNILYAPTNESFEPPKNGWTGDMERFVV